MKDTPFMGLCRQTAGRSPYPGGLGSFFGALVAASWDTTARIPAAAAPTAVRTQVWWSQGTDDSKEIYKNAKEGRLDSGGFQRAAAS